MTTLFKYYLSNYNIIFVYNIIMSKKEVCTCENENVKSKGIGTFFLFNNFNNRYNSKNVNTTTDILTRKVSVNTNRENSTMNCEGISKQEKLKVRHRPTPFRMPYNHHRKQYNCNTANCIKNEKIFKDTPSDLDCCKPKYVQTRLVDKSGFKLKNTEGSYISYLNSSGKLYTKHAFGILPQNKVSENSYKIGDGVGTKDNSNCKISYEIVTSLKTKRITTKKMPVAVRKWANPRFSSRSSVSSRNRIQRLKYDAIIGGQQKKNNYNNCINGQLCNKYQNPGPNTKSKTNVDSNICVNTNIYERKQSCP